MSGNDYTFSLLDCRSDIAEPKGEHAIITVLEALSTCLLSIGECVIAAVMRGVTLVAFLQ